MFCGDLREFKKKLMILKATTFQDWAFSFNLFTVNFSPGVFFISEKFCHCSFLVNDYPQASVVDEFQDNIKIHFQFL